MVKASFVAGRIRYSKRLLPVLRKEKKASPIEELVKWG
jgi:hypothetical protein